MSLKERVDGLLSAAVERGDVPGVVAVVVDREGVVYEGAFGKRNLATGEPMTLDTVCWIASMTKAITGACTMQMVEQGKLDLDAPADQWVPMLKEAQVLEGWDDEGKPKLRPPVRPITLRQLLTHTAGFSYEFWSADILRYQQVMGVPGVASGKIAALTTPLLFDPGERWEYGINIDFAGLAVEAVSGKKLGQYMQDHLLGPLGMNDTAFNIRPDMRARLAVVHARGEDGSLAPIAFEIPQDPEFEMGGGGLYGTAGDYARFVRMVLNRGELDGLRVLSAETVALMCQNAIGNLRVTPMKSVMPQFSNDAEFFPGLPKGWGLTWQINLEPAPTGRPAGSLQWAGLANSYFWIDLDHGIGGIYLTQIVPFADTKSLPLFEAFETTVYQSMHPSLGSV
ncbi:serine hydrolase domain-containing protein [Roseiflexus castenholzii]|jgi:CubicO group peptidase (beta-lactamase class C family)|uniref:Beta-lactamase n=1 Tax=Roseiflexus castenholzii (strain DSM 13941 / HLO8) TaxID=383372 RepID=A7NM79_ROSCS|nr:serine hydrolase domain-containing protein [Roseiflexus castenholzii]ABU58634.1 beta-lactamase [Roseiflexus castenholzii DSM 13941]